MITDPDSKVTHNGSGGIFFNRNEQSELKSYVNTGKDSSSPRKNVSSNTWKEMRKKKTVIGHGMKVARLKKKEEDCKRCNKPESKKKEINTVSDKDDNIDVDRKNIHSDDDNYDELINLMTMCKKNQVVSRLIEWLNGIIGHSSHKTVDFEVFMWDVNKMTPLSVYVNILTNHMMD